MKRRTAMSMHGQQSMMPVVLPADIIDVMEE